MASFDHLLCAVLLALVALVAALAAPSSANVDLEVRQLPPWTGVYICQDADWSGRCEHRINPLGSNNCIELDGETTAFGPDQGISCTLFKNGVCRDFGEGTLTLQYPGLPNVGPEWNDQALSYYCIESQAE